MAWVIKMYHTASGSSPVEKFVKSLDATSIAKLGYQLRLLQEFGPNLGMPHARSLGHGLFELRIRGKREIRMFYYLGEGRTICMLHAFVKKAQKTPARELFVARKRQKDSIDFYECC